MIYLTYAELLHVAERAIGGLPLVRDAGLLEAAAVRPQTAVFGRDAYPSLDEKAAALTHALARNHALVDGNKRLALGGLIAFLGVNGQRLTLTNDEAYELIIAVSIGELNEIADIANASEQLSKTADDDVTDSPEVAAPNPVSSTSSATARSSVPTEAPSAGPA